MPETLKKQLVHLADFQAIAREQFTAFIDNHFHQLLIYKFLNIEEILIVPASMTQDSKIIQHVKKLDRDPDQTLVTVLTLHSEPIQDLSDIDDLLEEVIKDLISFNQNTFGIITWLRMID